MAHPELATSIISKFGVQSQSLRFQRALLISAQTDFYQELGVRVSPRNDMDNYQRCLWSGSMKYQEAHSASHPLEDPELEQYRRLAVVAAASFEVIVRLGDVGIDTSVLQTPAVYAEVAPEVFTRARYNPVDLVRLPIAA